MNFYIFSAFFLSCLFVNCDSSAPQFKIRPVVPDSSITAIDNELFEAFPAFTKAVGLPSIENGVDSLEYRLWMHAQESGNVINLIRIRYTGNQWKVSETLIWSHIPEYKLSRDDTINHLLETIVDSTRSRALKPDISMNRFIDSLQYFNLQQAPSNSEITGSFELGTDSWRYTFEISDKNNYRIIEYNCPISVHSLLEFHKKIIGLLDFLKRRLSVTFTDCSIEVNESDILD